MLLGLGAALLAALLYGVAAVGQAAASRRLPALEDGAVHLVVTAVRDPLLMGMVAAYLVGALLHLVAIERAPLYIAQAGIAAALPVTAIASAIALREPLRGTDWVAVVATFAGIAVLAVDAGDAGSVHHVGVLTVALYVGLAVMAALAVLAYRGHGRGSAVALGLLGGVGYTGTALGARLLSGAGSPVLFALLVVLIATSGVLGFWLYSFAMQRLSVAAASAPLILVETLLPTLVGIGVLGDGVPVWWSVVLGLLLALGGAVYLAGFEGRVLEPPQEVTA